MAFELDTALARRHFDHAASTYDQAAHLQRQIGEWLLEHLDDLPDFVPATVVDLGCGTGALIPDLAQRYPQARLLAMDWATAMARRAPDPAVPVCADALGLPLADHSVDLVVTNLMLQWVPDPRQVFAECARVLRPGGWLACATFGPDTLVELRASWAAVDGQAHVNEFIDMHHLGDALMGLGFSDPVLDVDRLRPRYADLRELTRELKALGAHNALRQRRRGLLGKQAYARLRAAYETHRDDQGLPASYEVIYAVAQAARAATPGEAFVPLDQIQRSSSPM